MRVGYARVSTLDQFAGSAAPGAKRGRVREGLWREKASGDRADRPELRRVLADVLRHCDTLVVWKLDRLARSLKQLIVTAEDLQNRKIGLVSLTEDPDTTTPTGRLVSRPRGVRAAARSVISQTGILKSRHFEYFNAGKIVKKPFSTT
jgi:DNA invertase Pin-like site-specific DNA recombinase